MNSTKLFILFVATCFIYSCSSRTIKGDPQVISIDNIAVDDTSDITEIISHVEIVPLLESNDDHIGSISQLRFTNNKYLIYDIKTKKVQAYNKNGDFIKTLSKNGHEEGQGLNILGFFVNYNGEIEVLDFAQMQVNRFDTALNLVGSVKGEKLLHYFSLASIPNSTNYAGYAGFTIHNSSTNSELDILNEKLNRNSQYFKYKNEYIDILTMIYNAPFYLYKDSLRFMKHFDPFIYNIDNQNITKRFKFEYVKGNIPSNYLNEIVAKHLSEFKNPEYIPSKRNAFFNGYTYPRDVAIESEHFVYLLSAINNNGAEKTFNSLIDKKDYKVLQSGSMLKESKRYRLSIPRFHAYDPFTEEFITHCDGNELKQYLSADSPLLQNLDINNASFYIIKTKINREK